MAPWWQVAGRRSAAPARQQVGDGPAEEVRRGTAPVEQVRPVGGPTRAWALAATVLGIVLALDQISKALVEASIAPGEHVQVLPALDLTNVRNAGIAFGALASGGLAVAALTAVALLLLLTYFGRHLRVPLLWLPVGMILGGALGNILDRARQGAVTDFIDFAAWPAFNVADTSIVLGVLALLYLVEGRPRRRSSS